MINCLNGSLCAVNPEKEYKYYSESFNISLSDSIYLFTSDGYKIYTCFIEPANNNNNTTILIAYGDAGNLSYYYYCASKLRDFGYTVVLFDYRGFGKSSDWETDTKILFYKEFVTDLLTVTEYSKKRFPANKIGIMAISMGSIITTLTIPQIKIDFIVAENYVVTLSGVVERLKLEKNKQCYYPSEIKETVYEEIINNIDIPVLLFTSLEDRITTYEDSQIMGKNSKCKNIVYNGKHGQGMETLQLDYFIYIQEFITSKFKSPSTPDFPTPINSGKKKKTAKKENINPPTLPAANGNQKASLYSPIMKGINPRMVDTMVKKIGFTLTFQAFR
jgi:predicted alpha/beta hydrolase